MSLRTVGPKGGTAAERAAALRQRDAALGLKQVNIRVPATWDTTMQMIARALRHGQRIDGVVFRDLKTGRVRTQIV